MHVYPTENFSSEPQSPVNYTPFSNQPKKSASVPRPSSTSPPPLPTSAPPPAPPTSDPTTSANLSEESKGLRQLRNK